jgi:hypothetical protein
MDVKMTAATRRVNGENAWGRKVLAWLRSRQNGRRGRPPGRPVALRRCIERAQEHAIEGICDHPGGKFMRPGQSQRAGLRRCARHSPTCRRLYPTGVIHHALGGAPYSVRGGGSAATGPGSPT